jgi:hypothetical protein
MSSSGMLRRVAVVKNDDSEEHITSIIKVTRIGELETLAVTSMRSTLRRRYFPHKRWFLEDPHGIASQKTACFVLNGSCERQDTLKQFQFRKWGSVMPGQIMHPRVAWTVHAELRSRRPVEAIVATSSCLSVQQHRLHPVSSRDYKGLQRPKCTNCLQKLPMIRNKLCWPLSRWKCRPTSRQELSSVKPIETKSVLTMVYNTQNCWDSGHCPSSGILNN